VLKRGPLHWALREEAIRRGIRVEFGKKFKDIVLARCQRDIREDVAVLP